MPLQSDIQQGDCMDVLKGRQGGQFDLIFTSLALYLIEFILVG